MGMERIDGVLEAAVANSVFPGVTAVVGDRDGGLYEGAFGRLSVDGEAPARPDTMIRIASMTKAFVSVAALQLLEQGRLELQQPVADVLPAFGDLQVLEGFDGDEPRLRRPGEPGDDTAAADAYRRPGLLVRQRRSAALSPGQRHPRTGCVQALLVRDAPGR